MLHILTTTLLELKLINTKAPDPASPPDAALWIPPILRSISTDGTGIPELAAAIARHAEYLRTSGGWSARERSRLESELDVLIREALVKRFEENLAPREFEKVVDRMLDRELSPWEAVNSLLNGKAG